MSDQQETLKFLEYKHPFERGFRTASGDEYRNMGQQLGPRIVFQDTDIVERTITVTSVPREANAKYVNSQALVTTTIEPPVRRRINGNNRAAIL